MILRRPGAAHPFEEKISHGPIVAHAVVTTR
jgi:hypothetical protein